MGIVSNMRDSKTIKNLDDLLLINFSLSEELTGKEIKEQFYNYNEDLKLQTKEIEDTIKKIKEKEDSVKKINKEIDRDKGKINKMKENMGLAKIFVYARPSYWKIRKDIKTIKKIKKEMIKTIQFEYVKLKMKKEELKNTRKSRKLFSKDIAEFAREHQEEITFVKNFEKNQRKMLKRNPEEYRKIQNMVNIIKANNGEWPKDVQDEKGNSISLQEAYNRILRNEDNKDLSNEPREENERPEEQNGRQEEENERPEEQNGRQEEESEKSEEKNDHDKFIEELKQQAEQTEQEKMQQSKREEETPKRNMDEEIKYDEGFEIDD